jgi:hypothetical protein
MRKRLVFTIGLGMIKGAGDITRPLCQVTIPPEDESRKVYESGALTMNDHGFLHKTSIICKEFGSIIYLEGFRMLNEQCPSPLNYKGLITRTYIL